MVVPTPAAPPVRFHPARTFGPVPGAVPPPPWNPVAPAGCPDVEQGERRVADERRRWDRPVVLEHHQDVTRALALLEHEQQAVGFVWGGDGFVGVVTAEDLRFAADWVGPGARVDDAMTFSIIEIGRDADLAVATEAFSDGLRRWVVTHGGPGAQGSRP